MAYRKEKLEELIKRLVADLILKEVKDPRIGFVTVSGVSLSNDKKVAKVGISILGDAREARKTLEGLQSASGYIQHRIGKAIKTRSTPKIQFFLDSSVADGVRMVNILNNIENEENHKTENDQSEKTSNFVKES